MRIILERTPDGWSYDVLTASGPLFKRATGLQSPGKALECAILQIYLELNIVIYRLELVRPGQSMVRLSCHRIGWCYAVPGPNHSFPSVDGFPCAGKALEAYFNDHDSNDVDRLEFTELRFGAP